MLGYKHEPRPLMGLEGGAQYGVTLSGKEYNANFSGHAFYMMAWIIFECFLLYHNPKATWETVIALLFALGSITTPVLLQTYNGLLHSSAQIMSGVWCGSLSMMFLLLMALISIKFIYGVKWSARSKCT